MRIAVVGAGIGGLVVALALARTGRSVTIFERAPALVPVGAGLQLSPNALDVLDRLGLRGRLEAVGVRAETVTLRRGSSGRAIARVPVGASDGRGYLSLLRADLQDALLAAVLAEPRVALRLGKAVRALDRGDDWALEFEGGGDAHRCDLVVAADGVHSTVASLRGHPAPIESGASAMRLRIAQSRATGIEAWLGPRRHAVAYPVAAGRETNLVLVVPSAIANDPPHASFQGWDPRLQSLIEEAEGLGVWPLLTRPPHWREPGLAYVGDAAHAMLPYAAQGAAMAIEDGWVLAAALAREPDVGRALAAFETAREPRVSRVLGRVAFHRLVYHLPAPVSLARDAVLAVTPAKRLKDKLAWLYDWRAPVLETVHA